MQQTVVVERATLQDRKLTRAGAASCSPTRRRCAASRPTRRSRKPRLRTQIAAAGVVRQVSFRPLIPRVSEGFGTRRTFNGKLASIHRGLDYHAKPGLAGNGGELRRSGAGARTLLRRQLRHHRPRPAVHDALHASVASGGQRRRESGKGPADRIVAELPAGPPDRIFMSPCAGRAPISIRPSCGRSAAAQICHRDRASRSPQRIADIQVAQSNAVDHSAMTTGVA